jgi:uncharacterized protein
MDNSLRWFEIYVSDMKRAKAFYEKVFGFHFKQMQSSPELEMYGLSAKASDNSFGTLVRMKGLTPSGVSTVIYFGSEDCAKEEAKVAAAGGKIHKTKFSIGEYGFIALIHDTEGNMIGIHSTK